jgi:transposase
MQTAQETACENPLDIEQSLQDRVATLEQALQRKDVIIDILTEQLRLLRHKHFGSSTEQLSVDQMALLFNEGEAISETAPVAGHITYSVTRAKAGGRRPLPPELPRAIVEHDLAEDEKICPHDGQALHRVGTEESEQLDIVPMKIQVIRHVRHIYGCRCCEQTMKTATLPPQPIAQSIASPGTLAHIITAKYTDHMPLYRQEKILKRHGLEISRATLAQWMIQAGALIQPLINLLDENLRAGPLIQMDESPLQVLKENGRAATSESYMWVRRGGPPNQPIVLFHYAPSRAAAIAAELLQDFRGVLQSDGYIGYAAVGAQEGRIHAACFAHARRKFDEALKALPQKARGQSQTAQAIALIGQLYQIERDQKQSNAIDRHQARQQHSMPILAQLRDWMERVMPTVPPASLLGKALHYLNAQWPKLIRYAEDGQIPIDTNAVENAIRPFALGRRNWLFSASPKGAQASAQLYSLIETAKANIVDPYKYLRRVFTDLPNATTIEDIEALLPWNVFNTTH